MIGAVVEGGQVGGQALQRIENGPRGIAGRAGDRLLADLT